MQRIPIERTYIEDMAGCGWYCVAVLRVDGVEVSLRLGAWKQGPRTLAECWSEAIACAKKFAEPGATLGFENGCIYT
jgi:hypothetical protein